MVKKELKSVCYKKLSVYRAGELCYVGYIAIIKFKYYAVLTLYRNSCIKSVFQDKKVAPLAAESSHFYDFRFGENFE